MNTSVYRAYGKWILTGEHAVLRGCPALVFPLQQQFMEFTYIKSSEDIKIEIKGLNKKTLSLLL